MTKTVEPRWQRLKTLETRQVEELLSKFFDQVDAYRYNSASIRVRVIDPRFEGKEPEKRDKMVEKHLRELPEKTQADIINLFTFSPTEIADKENHPREWLLNLEFDDYTESKL